MHFKLNAINKNVRIILLGHLCIIHLEYVDSVFYTAINLKYTYSICTEAY